MSSPGNLLMKIPHWPYKRAHTRFNYLTFPKERELYLLEFVFFLEFVKVCFSFHVFFFFLRMALICAVIALLSSFILLL